MNLVVEIKIVRKTMSDDQMRKYISSQVMRSRFSLFSRSTCSTIAAIFILCVYMIMIVPTVHAQDVTPSTSQQATTLSSSDSSENSAADVGMKAASAVATIVYFPFKIAFALGGGVVGGLAYVFTGGNEEAAKSIWQTSMEGTYNITPENLTGEEPVHFFGPTQNNGISPIPGQ